MTVTPHLGLPLLDSDQAQKHLTVNRAFMILDHEVSGSLSSVKDKDLATPPVSPADGDSYIIASTPTGAWVGHTKSITYWDGSIWNFIAPSEGFLVWVQDEDALYVYDGTNWVLFSAGFTGSFVAKSGDTMTGALRLPVGSAAAPSLAMGEATSGLFRKAVGEVGIAVAGAMTGYWNTGGLVISPGITGSQFTGIYIEKIDGTTATVNAKTEGAACNMVPSRYSTDANGSLFQTQKARGTIAVPTVCLQNDLTGDYSTAAYNGAAFTAVTRFRASVIAATPSGTDLQSRMTFSMCPAGSITMTELLRLEYDSGLMMYGANVVINQNRHFRKRQYAAASLPSQASGDEIGSSDIIAAHLVSDGTEWLSPGVLRKRAITANTTISIPGGWAIDHIHFAETAGAAVTGGIKIGTTSGATDVVVAQAVAANSLDTITSANVLKRVYSRTTTAQTLFIQAVTAWNSATVEMSFALRKVF